MINQFWTFKDKQVMVVLKNQGRRGVRRMTKKKMAMDLHIKWIVKILIALTCILTFTWTNNMHESECRRNYLCA